MVAMPGKYKVSFPAPFGSFGRFPNAMVLVEVCVEVEVSVRKKN